METKGVSSFKGFLFVLTIFAASLQVSTAIVIVEMAEEDVSVRESDGIVNVEVTITTRGSPEDPVTIVLAPLSVQQYKETGGEVEINEDPAIPDMDFNSTIHTLTIVPSLAESQLSVSIPIVNDKIAENKEVFMVLLRVLDDTTVLERDMTIVYIRTDIADAVNTRLEFNMALATVNEGVGVVNNTVYIEVHGTAEPVLVVNLELFAMNGEDISLFSTSVTIPPSTSRVAVPFQITEDAIFEGEEMAQISLSQPPEYSHLYKLGAVQTLTVIIQDNDVARIGIEVAEGRSSLMEGDNTTVCVRLLEPEQLSTFIDLVMSQPPNVLQNLPEVAVTGASQFALSEFQLEHCLTVSVKEDEAITQSWSLPFSLELHPFFTDFASIEDSSVLLEPGQVHLSIVDNDGIPVTPSNIQAELINNDQDMLVRWDSSSTTLQPVQQYVVEVQAFMSSRVAKRQIDLHDNTVQRYITTETEIVVQGIDPSVQYSVLVCAENTIGRTCREPLMVTDLQLTSLGGNKPGGLSPGGGREAPLPVWVYAVAGVVLVLLCLVLVCLVGLCVCRQAGRMKSYYPSKQENKINKVEGSDERYTVRRSSSTLSTHWEVMNSDEYKPEDV